MEDWSEICKGVYLLPQVISYEDCDKLIDSISDSWWDLGPEPVDGLPLWQTKSMGNNQAPEYLFQFSKKLSLRFLVPKICDITGFNKEKLLGTEFWPFMRKYQHDSLGRDSFKLHPDPTHYSVVFLLSDSDSFEGGDFIIKPNIWKKPIAIPMRKGDCVVFKGSKKHGVEKVLSGVRYSLNFFFWDSDDESKVYLTKLQEK